MSNKFKFLILCVILVGALYGKPVYDKVSEWADKETVVPAPVVVVETPDKEYQSLVEGLSDIVTDKGDRIQIRDFFLEVADVMETEPKLVKTTGQFREFNSMSGQINFSGLSLKDKYSGLGEKIDSVISNSIGKEDVPLDAKKRESLVKALKAIAWSLNN